MNNIYNKKITDHLCYPNIHPLILIFDNQTKNYQILFVKNIENPLFFFKGGGEILQGKIWPNFVIYRAA